MDSQSKIHSRNRSDISGFKRGARTVVELSAERRGSAANDEKEVRVDLQSKFFSGICSGILTVFGVRLREAGKTSPSALQSDL